MCDGVDHCADGSDEDTAALCPGIKKEHLDAVLLSMSYIIRHVYANIHQFPILDNK